MPHNFDLALESSGQRYLNLELDLRKDSQADGAEAEFLRLAADSHSDPVARLVARTVLDWSEPKGGDFKAALDYLDYAPVKLAPTVKGFPSPMGIESYLTLHFADRVTELMAVRLIKGEGWPRWKAVGIIFYLKAHRVASTTSALLRFAIETSEAEWREFALEAIREIHDPDLPAKLTFEIARAQKRGRAVPAEVRALAD
jgi:hypothetical protein